MEYRKKQHKNSRSRKKDEDSSNKFQDTKLEKTIRIIIAIILILYLLYKLALTGGRGYDHFIGEPLEWRIKH